jgi:shikimate kinase/3-dehydroquinate synthase
MTELAEPGSEDHHRLALGELVSPTRAAEITRKLGGRSIVLVGMMGAGKTSIGKRLAAALQLPFIDADVEIETAAGMTISEIFARHGEAYFRDGERRVIGRILADSQCVLATGGGAYMNATTRERIAERGVSIWLKADADVLLRRVKKRPNRPLLQTRDPEETLRALIDERYPVYALADFCLISKEGPHEAMVEAVIDVLERGLETLPRLQHESATMTAPVSPARQSATIVPVELGARRYDILIGKDLIARAGEEIARVSPKSACAIVTDENVAHHHLPALQASLDAAGIRHTSIIIKPGEASKCYETFASVCDQVIAARMERRDIILALGGGVVGDLAGFVAATVRRGMRFVQIPTTVLSQVDSSVGGKTAINSPHGKNLIGAFYQPSLVLADLGSLATLDPREFRAGYAEVAKYGVIDDEPFFHWLEKNHADVFARGDGLTHAIATSCRSKASIVARDETEQGDRALLNLGHTFGHAFEALTHYDTPRLNHGEGVAIGMACALRFSAYLGYCASDDAARVEAHLKSVGLPSRIRNISNWNFTAEQILDAMYQDKKVERGALTFILARGIGQSFIAKGVSGEMVLSFLRDELGR